MPAMSATEREALEAGTVSWEGDLFSGVSQIFLCCELLLQFV